MIPELQRKAGIRTLLRLAPGSGLGALTAGVARRSAGVAVMAGKRNWLPGGGISGMMYDSLP